mmetsp:Transcript_4567/g.17260  ORF Transcript_4567/g.17260 Transcript_4567/m.17260 type:complete len:85 (+) Transcript_4567:2-256(+)
MKFCFSQHHPVPPQFLSNSSIILVSCSQSKVQYFWRSLIICEFPLQVRRNRLRLTCERLSQNRSPHEAARPITKPSHFAHIAHQ